MTRTWEIETNPNALAVDLVREQDFILRLRRLQRLGTPHFVANLALSAIPVLVGSRIALESAQSGIKEFAKVTNGTYAEMTNGDIFVYWEGTGDAALLTERLMKALPADAQLPRSMDSFLISYQMPRDYTALRERTNHYIEIARTMSTMAAELPADVLKSDAARGPLTAWGVDQIGKLLNEIDIRTYARTQPIYRAEGKGGWRMISEEYFVSFSDLRRERFPKLDLITPEHLFLALCEMVDQRLLSTLANKYATIADRSLHLNLSVATVIGNAFLQFTHSVPRDKRRLLTFELHRGDLFQDFARTLNAVDILHREGFKVAIDSVTPDMLPYLNLNAFGLDYMKINVSGDRTGAFADPAVRKSFMQLPADRLIFFRCDSDKAFKLGGELGVNLFQGWHIDDLAGGKRNQI